MKLIEEKTLHTDRYTILKEIRYIDDGGEPHAWTFLERNEGREAVVIVPITEKTGTLILIKQFRVPFKREVIEFPAGLVDTGERPEETAARELLEETGYAGRIVEMSPEVSTSAGLTTELVRIVLMEVGEEPVRAQALEGSERIHVLRVPPGGEKEFLARALADGIILDAKVQLHLTDAARPHPIPPDAPL